ncbi:hypothetical protein CO179_03255, partial [candidate division WWE3 bacterium CG_4_9_14_3_um_filter_39_7]
LLQGTGDASGCYRGFQTSREDVNGDPILPTFDITEITCPAVIESSWQTATYETTTGVLGVTGATSPASFDIWYPGEGFRTVTIDSLGKVSKSDFTADTSTPTCSTSCNAVTPVVFAGPTPTPIPTATPVPLNCWGIGGVCDSACNVSSIASRTVYTSFSSSSCTLSPPSVTWKRSDGSYSSNQCSMLIESDTSMGQVYNCQSTGCSSSQACCYELTGNSIAGYLPTTGNTYYNGVSCSTSTSAIPSTLTNASESYNSLIKHTITTGNTFTFSGAVTRYNGSGFCSVDGSGNCHKLSGQSSYYPGDATCTLYVSPFPSNYYSNSESCTWY